MASRSSPRQSEVRHFLDPGDIAAIGRSPCPGRAIEILEGHESRQHEIMNGLRRELVKECRDMRAPARIDPRRSEALQQRLRIDRMRTRCIDGAEDKVDLTLRRLEFPVSGLQLPSDELEVLGRG